MRDAFGRIRTLLAVALLAWLGLRGGLPPLVAEWRARAEVDVVSLDSERYEPLVASIPGAGTIGYLLPDDWPSIEAISRFYVAQYVLTPRLVVLGAAPPYVIVSPETSVPDDGGRGTESRDPRLKGFTLYERFPNGMRVFRRLE